MYAYACLYGSMYVVCMYVVCMYAVYMIPTVSSTPLDVYLLMIGSNTLATRRVSLPMQVLEGTSSMHAHVHT